MPRRRAAHRPKTCARRGRVLALFVRLDRHAEGRAPHPHEPDGRPRSSTRKPCSASARTTCASRPASSIFAYGLGNGMSFPMSVGATAVLLPDRPTPRRGVRGAAARAADALLRRADALRRDAGGSGLHAGERLAAAALVRLGRRRRCPSMSALEWKRRFGVDILDGIGSTEMLHIFVSNRPGELRYGTSGKPVPGYEAAHRRRERARTCRTARLGELSGARRRPRRTATGTSARRRAAPSRASGRAPATNTCASRTAMYRYCGRTDDMFKVSRPLGLAVRGGVRADLAPRRARSRRSCRRRTATGCCKPKAFVVLKDGAQATKRCARR